MKYGILIILALACLGATTLPAPKPHEAVDRESCVRAECHANVRSYAVVHGPIGVNACDACHELTDAKTHAYKLTREKAELCTYCHEFNLSGLPVLHKPVREGQCLGCHDPHGGSSKALIREASMSALCKRCHEDITRGRTFLHTPVKEGACDSCHTPHASRFGKLLDVAGPDMCLTCHESFDAGLAKAKFTHKAMEKGCEKCHDPHGSKFSMSTTQPVVQQCGGCHDKLSNEASAARYPHSPVSKERACLTCHTPHGSALAKLVSDTPEKLCMTCHDKDQKAANARVIPAVAELKNAQAIKHGGIKDGSCAGCHASHGGNRPLFLSQNYSPVFYQRFSPTQYELCFGCHDAKLVTETKTTKLTAFRNGDRNLHALHVRDTRERGESCRVCHNTHAGTSARIVRDGIRFGAWNLPVRFSKTASGGSCYPGCHPLYGYDREHGVKNTPGTATTLPTVAALSRERPALVSLETTDIAGAAIKVPDALRVTVLTLLQSDESDAKRTVNAVTQVLRDRTDTQSLIVLRSANRTAGQQPKWLASSREAGASILTDPDGAIAAELGVRGFPMILIIQRDGSEIARIGGDAESLALKLPTYLDLAAGKIDAAGAEKRIVTHDSALGDAAAAAAIKAARDVRRIQLLIDTGQPAEAIQLLIKLPPGELPPWQHNLLGARALLALDRWREAQEAAQTALQQNPDPACAPDIHYLLGRIYEHAQDWPRAAAEYRAAAVSKD